MKFIFIFCFFYSTFLLSTSSASKIFQVYAKTQNQLETLIFFQRTKFDFWTEPILDGATEIFVRDENVDQFQSYLVESSTEFKILHEDVETMIMTALKQLPTNRDADYNWNNYYPLDSINNWIVEMSNNHSDLTEIFEIGYSNEGRLMKVIRVGRPAADGQQKPAVFIDAGIHAREWISITSGTYFINQLLTNQNEYNDILNGLDIYFLPVVNPDGYEFTWNTSDPTNRMWRKTRSINPASGCIGVDANRNYGFHWGEGGTSDDPCSFYHSGLSPWSEPEIVNLRDFILERKSGGVNWNLYVTLHTHLQQILAPWGYTNEKPDNYAQHLAIGNAAADAIRQVNGIDFEVTSSSENGLLSGNSRDWAKGEANISFCYTFELRNSTYGHLVPVELIETLAQESWAGMLVMLKYFVP